MNCDRKQAIREGWKVYHGKPHSKCGETLKFTKDSKCVKCCREHVPTSEEKARKRAWSQSPKAKEAKRAYRQSSEGKAAVSAYNHSRKAHMKVYNRLPKSRAAKKAYKESPEGKCKKNAWLQSEKGKASVRVSTRNNRAKRLDVEGSHTAQEIVDLMAYYFHRCLCCRRHESELEKPLQPDHVIPIGIRPILEGATNYITNIQPLCEPCNGMGGKGTKSTDYRIYYIFGSFDAYTEFLYQQVTTAA